MQAGISFNINCSSNLRNSLLSLKSKVFRISSNLPAGTFSNERNFFCFHRESFTFIVVERANTDWRQRTCVDDAHVNAIRECRMSGREILRSEHTKITFWMIAIAVSVDSPHYSLLIYYQSIFMSHSIICLFSDSVPSRFTLIQLFCLALLFSLRCKKWL